MSDQFEFEEEEFDTQFNGQTILRIVAQLKPYWMWVVIFLAATAAVAFTEAYFTYLSKRIIDEGIVARNRATLVYLLQMYGGLVVVQSVFVFSFIYLAG